MKKNKGVALPSVLVLMSVVICFSLVITTLVISSNLAVQYQAKSLDNQICVGKLCLDFVDDGVIENDFDFDVEIFENENNSNQKALVVKRKNAGVLSIYYLCIYDFENNKTLANQTEKFSITTKNVAGQDYYYFCDLIKYKQVE